MFKELFTESREDIKRKYLTPNFNYEYLKELKTKPGRLYIQYKDSRARSGLSSGNVIKLDKKGVVIDSNRFGETNIEIPYKDITFATNIK